MDTTNDYNDEPDYDQMIAEDQWGCAGPGQPSDDDIEDRMREEYNAGDRAAKRPRLGPEPAVDNRVPARVPIDSEESPGSNHPGPD